ATTPDGTQFDATATPMGDNVPWSVVASRPSSYREALARKSLIAILIAIAVVCGVAVLIGAFVTEQVTQPVREVATAMEALERGNLTERPLTAKRWHAREISSLLQNTESSITRLRDLVGTLGATAATLTSVTDHLGSTSREIHGTASRNSENVSTSRGVLSDLAAAAGRIRDSVRGLTQSTSGTAESARMLEGAATSIVQNMETLSGAIETVVGAVQRMETEVGGMGSNVLTTHRSVERVTSSLVALNQGIQSVEQAARESAELSDKTTKDAMNGRSASAETMRAMQTIIESFRRLSDSISALAARSDAIDRIIVVIDDVTRATNLLAFNASIIAAQAGEHGAGFAVVAERVKSLADSTRQSTREIGDLVLDVRREITNAAEEITESARSIQDGEALSLKAAESLGVIIESSEEAAQMVGRISAATQQQGRRLRDLEQSVEDLRAVNDALDRSSNEQRNALQFIATSVLNARDINERVVATARAQAEETKTISSASQTIDSRTKDIQFDADEQREGTGLLLDMMTNFAELVETNETRSRSLDDAVGELTKRLDSLNQSLGAFKL
ncbi:MAG: methyl-accepting chemotaxis protein, partial [Myxococcota bacterium]